MRRPAVLLVIYLAMLQVFWGLPASSRNILETATAHAQEYPWSNFSSDQLDNLLAPIALYPDPLLAQVLPAATFVDQVDEAARWMRAYNNTNAIDYQPWDVSVKAVAHYPSVLYMMSDQIDWTTSLGQAYVYQSTDVMTSIQRLRALAYSAGNLVTNQQQQVIVEGSYIRIDPFQPRFIYVPTYDPRIVYIRRSSYSGDGVLANIISFGVGLAIGAWLNSDWDWPGHRVYYHGWQGGGWIARSRPNVRITNVYVNNNYTNIQINRNVVQRSVNYNNLTRYTSVHRDVDYRNAGRNNKGAPASPSAGNKVIRRNVDVTDPRIDTYRGHPPAQQPATQPNRPATPARPAPATKQEERTPSPQTKPQLTPISPREPAPSARTGPQQPTRDVQRPPTSVFGENRSGLDPRATSQRGQVSRERTNQPATMPAAKAPTAPAPRTNPSATRPAATSPTLPKERTNQPAAKSAAKAANPREDGSKRPEQGRRP
jgi:uncharacterized protein DUF3300